MTKITHRDSATFRVLLDTDLSRSPAPGKKDERPAELQVDATFASEQGAVFLHVQADARRVTVRFETPAQFKAFMNDRLAPEQLGIPGVAGNEDLLRLVQRSADVRDIDDFRWARDGMAFREEDREVRRRAGIAEASVAARSVAEGAQGLVRRMQRFLIENGCLRPTRGSRRNDDGVLGAGTRHGWLAFFRQHPATYEAFLRTVDGSTRDWLPPIDELRSANIAQLRAWARRDVAFPIEQLTTLHQAMSQVGVDAFEKQVAASGELETVIAGLETGAAAGAAPGHVRPGTAVERRSGAARRPARTGSGVVAERRSRAAKQPVRSAAVDTTSPAMTKMGALAALSAGGPTISRNDKTGKIERVVVDGTKITRGDAHAALERILGPGTVKAVGDAEFELNDRKVTGQVALDAAFLMENLGVDARGELGVTNNQVDRLRLGAAVERQLGPSSSVGAGGELLYRGRKLQSAALQAAFRAGKHISAEASVSVSRAERDQEFELNASVLAAMQYTQASGSRVKLTKTGFEIQGNELTKAQAHMVVDGLGYLFGDPEAFEAEASGNIVWTRGEGVSGDVGAKFKALAESGSYAVETGLKLDKGEFESFTASVNAQQRLGMLQHSVDGRLTVSTEGVSAKALGKVQVKGEAFNLSGSYEGSASWKDGQFELNASVLAALQYTQASGSRVKLTKTGFEIEGNELTKAQAHMVVDGLGYLFGDPEAFEAEASGNIVWTRGEGVSGDVGAKFKALAESGSYAVETGLKLDKGGFESFTASVNAEHRLDGFAVESSGKVTVEAKGVRVETLTEVGGKLGSVHLRTNIRYDGKVNGTIALGAFKSLKALRDDGSIDVRADGSIAIKDNKIDRVDVSALVTTLQGEKVDMAADGKLAYADGRIAGEVGTKLKAAFDSTELTASGTLKMADGKLDMAGKVSAMFEGSSVSAGGTIDIEGVDKMQLDFALKSKGEGTKLDASGKLVIDKGHIRGASMSTTLISTSNDANQTRVGANAVVFVQDSAMGAKLDADAGWGPLSAGLGLGAQYSVRELSRSAERIYVEHVGAFNATGKIGGEVVLPAGPLSLGFSASADASKQNTVRVVTSHPLSEAEQALARAPLTALRTPTKAAECDALLPNESVTRKGEASWGVRSKVSVGYGAGPAAIGVHGEAYVEATGIVEQSVERLPYESGNKVRVRLTLPGLGGGKSEKTKVKAFGIGASLTGEALDGAPLPDAIKQKAMPMIEKFATVGYERKLESLERGDTVFQAIFDLDNPKSRELLDRTMSLETSSALLVGLSANAKAYGVEIEKYVETNLMVESDRTDFNLSVLESTRVDQLIREEIKKFERGELDVLDTREARRTENGFWPWSPDYRVSVDFYNSRAVRGTVTTKDLGEVTVDGQLVIKQAPPTTQSTLANSPAALATRISIEDPVTSESNLWENYLNVSLTLLRALQSNEHGQIGRTAGVGASRAPGSPPASWETFADLFEMSRERGYDLAPARDGYLLGLGDERYKKSRLDLELLVVPRGIASILMRKPTEAERAKGVRGLQYRTATDFEGAYIEMEGNLYRDRVVVSSLRGVVDKVADALDAQERIETVDGQRGFGFYRGGERVDFVPVSDLERLEKQLWEEIPRISLHPAGPHQQHRGLGGGKTFEIARSDGGPPIRIRVSDSEIQVAKGALRRASGFGEKMGEVDEFFEQVREQGESSAFWNDPERYYNFFEKKFEEVLEEDDWKLVAPLVWAELAGGHGVYFRGGVDFSDGVEQRIIDHARRNVLEFGAFSLAAGRATLANGVLTIDVGTRPDGAAIEAAARQMFGAKVVRRGNTIVVNELDDGRKRLAALLATMQRDETGVIMPRSGAVSQDALDNAFGRRIAVFDPKKGVVFDNRPYDFFESRLGETLTGAFGPAFGADGKGMATFQAWGACGNQQLFKDGRVFTFEHRGRGVDDADLKVFNHTVGHAGDVGPLHDAFTAPAGGAR